MNLKMLCCLTVFCLGVPAALGDADIHEGCNMEKISSYGDACRLIRNWIGKMVEEGKIPSSKAANLEQALDALEKGADVKGPEGKRALMAAAALGGKEMVEFLFSKGAQPGSGEGWNTLLWEAAAGCAGRSGHTELEETLGSAMEAGRPGKIKTASSSGMKPCDEKQDVQR